ncbi:MAG: hypothetical protein IT445_10055 [Phycisphaeraceae bacterium]|nr:hypothetical protein [Phycisphaeraceae bacterium]
MTANPRDTTTNTLYYGDNLAVLREHISDESVDLIYLDPPFNSNADYNVLFAERDHFQRSMGWPSCGETVKSNGVFNFDSQGNAKS